MVARLESTYGAADRIDHADTLVTENAAGCGTSPLRMWRSVPQIVVFRILTTASPGSRIVGLGRSSRDFWPGP